MGSEMCIRDSPSTVSVREETYRALLTDIVASYKTHGFRHIVLIGDSGGNQDGLKAVAAAQDESAKNGPRVSFIPEYYNYGEVGEFLKANGVNQVPEGIHDDFGITAIMSTVDSALLAISSLFTQDFYRRVLPAAPQNRLTRVGKCFSWVLMGVMAYLAIRLPQTLWRLTEIKLEVLCQAAPTMFLGLHWARVGAKSVVAGLVVGLIVTLTLLFGQDLGVSVSGRPWGVHAGIWALAANVLVVWGHSLFVSRHLMRRSQESA